MAIRLRLAPRPRLTSLGALAVGGKMLVMPTWLPPTRTTSTRTTSTRTGRELDYRRRRVARDGYSSCGRMQQGPLHV